MKIFVCHAYRDVLRGFIAENASVRGYQTALAAAAGCQPSYLSQVLHGSVHLTPDHIAGMSAFWRLTEEESEYVFFLLQQERASAPFLKNMARKKIEKLRVQNESIENLGPTPERILLEEALLYYSNWMHQAVHILATLPGGVGVQDIARRLHVSEKMVQEACENLLGLRLLERAENRFCSTKKNIHLQRNSPLCATNHANWRHRALLKMQEPADQNIHYTAIHGLSRADAEKIRLLILELVEKTRALVAPSAEEDAVCLCVDFFAL